LLASHAPFNPTRTIKQSLEDDYELLDHSLGFTRIASVAIRCEALSLSPCNSPNIEATNSPLNSTNEEVTVFDSDTFTYPFAPPNTSSAESSSKIIDTSNMYTFQQPPIYTKRWIKDHLFTTTIDDPSKHVSTRCQLSTDALWCYFHAFLAKAEPKNYKEAMEESCWIEAMQEKIHEFERLKVWELVPRPDRAMIISLKWIFEVKYHEYGGVLKNKARISCTQEYGSLSDGCEDGISERDFTGRGVRKSTKRVYDW
ncbi:retrovirus-related pol polyprotein from transposon TNT 1-94, partial [Tanacetum coccineum]